MKEIINDIKTTYEINRSVFITYLKKVSKVEDAKSYIKEIKELHKDANHHINLYVIGKNGEIAHTTDDGEPSGTAGAPALEVFRKNDVTNFVCVIVRYFGGIKLGAGGLVRAYSTASSNALKEANLQEIIEMKVIKLTFKYNYLTEITNLINKFKYNILNKEFDTDIKILLQLPLVDLENFKLNLINLTNNQIYIEDYHESTI